MKALYLYPFWTFKWLMRTVVNRLFAIETLHLHAGKEVILARLNGRTTYEFQQVTRYSGIKPSILFRNEQEKGVLLRGIATGNYIIFQSNQLPEEGDARKRATEKVMTSRRILFVIPFKESIKVMTTDCKIYRLTEYTATQAATKGTYQTEVLEFMKRIGATAVPQ